MMFAIPVELLNALVAYLTRQPWAEVNELLVQIDQLQIIPEQEESEDVA